MNVVPCRTSRCSVSFSTNELDHIELLYLVYLPAVQSGCSGLPPLLDCHSSDCSSGCSRHLAGFRSWLQIEIGAAGSSRSPEFRTFRAQVRSGNRIDVQTLHTATPSPFYCLRLRFGFAPFQWPRRAASRASSTATGRPICPRQGSEVGVSELRMRRTYKQKQTCTFHLQVQTTIKSSRTRDSRARAHDHEAEVPAAPRRCAVVLSARPLLGPVPESDRRGCRSR